MKKSLFISCLCILRFTSLESLYSASPLQLSLSTETLDRMTVGITASEIEAENLANMTTINTTKLTGNNLTFASYINNKAPPSTLALFTSLNDQELKNALESAAPTRNAFTTYTSQNGYLASSQVVTDHLRERGFHRRAKQKNEFAFVSLNQNDFLVDASDNLGRTSSKKKENLCGKLDPYTVWVNPFGEYAREKKQHQTPAFSMGVGGAVAGFDYNGTGGDVLGVAGAYVHTKVHEANNGGHANVDQGFFTFYGTINASKWYFDLGIWGGYYHVANHRKISFPGFDFSAKSHSHGWQLAPHLEIGFDGFHMHNCGVRWIGIEPFVMGDWVANWEHSFREHGAEMLNVTQKGRFCSLARGETGLRFHETAKFDWGNMVFREKLSYAYQKTFHTGSIQAFLIGSPGSFSVDTLTRPQSLGIGEFNIFFVPHKVQYSYVMLRYQGEFGSRYQSHQGMIEVGKDF